MTRYRCFLYLGVVFVLSGCTGRSVFSPLEQTQLFDESSFLKQQSLTPRACIVLNFDNSGSMDPHRQELQSALSNFFTELYQASAESNDGLSVTNKRVLDWQFILVPTNLWVDRYLGINAWTHSYDPSVTYGAPYSNSAWTSVLATLGLASGVNPAKVPHVSAIIRTLDESGELKDLVALQREFNDAFAEVIPKNLNSGSERPMESMRYFAENYLYNDLNQGQEFCPSGSTFATLTVTDEDDISAETPDSASYFENAVTHLNNTATLVEPFPGIAYSYYLGGWANSGRADLSRPEFIGMNYASFFSQLHANLRAQSIRPLHFAVSVKDLRTWLGLVLDGDYRPDEGTSTEALLARWQATGVAEGASLTNPVYRGNAGAHNFYRTAPILLRAISSDSSVPHFSYDIGAENVFSSVLEDLEKQVKASLNQLCLSYTPDPNQVVEVLYVLKNAAGVILQQRPLTMGSDFTVQESCLVFSSEVSFQKESPNDQFSLSVNYTPISLASPGIAASP